MKVLGVSYGYHDASACVVVDGVVVAAAAEERFTRQKHDANFPAFAVEFCLAQAGLGIDDIDQVAFHEDPHAKFSRVLTSALSAFPGSRREFVNAMKSWLGKKLWSLGTISSRLGVDPRKIHYLSHHFSHAVQAFLGSGRDHAAVLVVDAVGDWASSALYEGRWVDGKPEVRRISEVAFPNSLGLVYSAFTSFLGFSPNDSEASTMALAGFGTPRYADAVRAIISDASDGTYEVDQRYFHFREFYRGPVTQRFLDVFGQPRSPNKPLPQSSLHDGPQDIDADAQRFADVAASVQLVIEERILQLAQHLRAQVDSPHLCYAGGVSLNCVANYKILASGLFETMYVPPDPGDGGTSVGTALLCAASQGGLRPEGMRHTPYVGPAHDERATLAMIEHVNPDHSLRYLKRGYSQPKGVRWSHQSYGDVGTLTEAVAKLLVERKIVGWYQGRAEMGPRALGNRSILIRPDDLALANRMSKLVKDRALFRPYAFSVSAEHAGRLLDMPAELHTFQRWMQFAVPVRPEAHAAVRAAIHIDGTTRPQICYPEDNPRYHRLLQAIGALLGHEVVVNTSFNPSGYPIVSTPVEALMMFARTDMDALVLNDTIVWKNRPAPADLAAEKAS